MTFRLSRCVTDGSYRFGLISPRHYCGPSAGQSPTTKYPAGGVPALARQKARAAAAWACTDCCAAAALECGTATVQQPNPRLPEPSVASGMMRYTRPSPLPWRSPRNCSEPTSISAASGERVPVPGAVIVFVGEDVHRDRQHPFTLVHRVTGEADVDQLVVGLVQHRRRHRAAHCRRDGIGDGDLGDVLIGLCEGIDHPQDVLLRAERLLHR